MDQHLEPLTGGLVTSRDAAELQPGELTQAKNCVYLPYDNALHRAFGRTQIVSVSTATSGVTGLRALQFDGDVVQLLAQANTNGGSPATWSITSNTATQIETLTSSGNHLETAQYKGRYFVFNGSNANRCYVASGADIGGRLNVKSEAFYEHGLKPVVTTPASATSSQVFSLTVTGLYEYWTTEVVKFASGGVVSELESTFVGDPATISVTATGAAPVIQRPAPVNNGVTHWRGYRSALKSLAADRVFPDGELITGDIDIDTPSFTDGGTASTVALVFPSSNGGNTNYDDWTNPANIGADDATATTANNAGGARLTRVRHMFYNFSGLSAVRGNVKGISVEIDAKYTGAGVIPVLTAYVGIRDSTTGLFRTLPPSVSFPQGLNPNPIGINAGWGISKRVPNLTTSYVVNTLGSTTDPWLPGDYSWTDTDMVNFGVVLEATFFQTVGTGAQSIEVDYMKVRVDYGALNSGDELRPFRTVTVNVGNLTSAIGADGPPPKSSTGAIFEDSLVVNDVAEPSKIKYSMPGYPESFPQGLYEIDFADQVRDVVTCIRAVGRNLVVGLRNSVWRVNYLPSEDDANFRGGRAVDIIDSGRGIVNPMAAAIFTGPEGRTELAFVSYDGLYSTDGFAIRKLSVDIDWVTPNASDTKIVYFDSIKLINNPTMRELVMYYQDSTSTLADTLGADLALHFSYDEKHLKNGGTPKVSGPVRVSNVTGASVDYVRAVCTQPTTSSAALIWSGYGGANNAKIWRDGYYQSATYVIPHDTDGKSIFTTRDMYLNGIGNEWTLETVHLYNGTPGSGSTMTVTPTYSLTDSDAVTAPALTFPVNKVLSRVHAPLMVEKCKLKFTESAEANVANAWLYALINKQEFGSEDSGV